MNVKGPVAPKDAEKKRPFFYIMQEKDIFGAKMENGKGVQFIYQNDNRLINSAKIAGNVTDEKIFELLKTTEGFRKLVAAIGVSVMEASGNEKVTFVYQMYGKTDPYQSGTSIVKEMTANGVEEVIELSEINWSDDDNEPGQIRFEFDTSELQASACVRFYLNEGFEAPEVVLDEKIDTDSKAYQDVVEKSLMQLGNPHRLKKAIDKARRGEDVTIAYIGGSITQGAGAIPIHKMSYAYRSFADFANCYGTGDNVHFVKAGVGGTPSELGMVRFDRDVLRDGNSSPDVVVIEFAVNDEGDETQGVCYDSLVRKVLALPESPAVVLLFAVFSYDWNLQDRLAIVGQTYHLPMVSIMDAVTDQFRVSKEQGRAVTKNQFFYDVFHPSNIGHMVMKDCLDYLWKKADEAEDMADDALELISKKVAIGNKFDEIRFFDRKTTCDDASIQEGSFSETDKDLQCVEMDDKLDRIPEFPYNWYADGTTGNEPFTMTITCKRLVLVHKDSGDISTGKVDVYVDGQFVRQADPSKNGWTHCNPLIIIDEKETKEHQVRIQMSDGDEGKKATILGFGYVK